MMNMMDSLELPYDMFWAGKMEPLSPDRSMSSSKSSFNNDLIVGNADEFWPIEDNLLSSFAIDDESTAGQNDTKNRPEELLNELIEFKEEGQWFNQENVDLSVFTAAAEASFAAPETTVTPMAFPSSHPLGGSMYPVAGHVQPPLINKVEGNNYVAATELLFNEIKNICSDFEASYQHLTPPQSPPPPTYPIYGHQHLQSTNQPQLATPKSQIVYGATAAPPSMTSPSANLFYCEERSFVDLQLQSSQCLDKTFVGDSNSQQDPDLMTLEFIDELLRQNTTGNKAAEISASFDSFQQIPTTDAATTNAMLDEEDYSDETSTQFSTPSYGNSLASSPSRSGSPMDSPDDEDWMPSATAVNEKKGNRSSSIKSLSSKRRPYARGGEVTEKKNRKKEQNKNAATRYRQKKKQEIEEILAEETKLRKVHKKLQTQFCDARREVKYLKNLLRDMYKQNNIII